MFGTNFIIVFTFELKKYEIFSLFFFFLLNDVFYFNFNKIYFSFIILERKKNHRIQRAPSATLTHHSPNISINNNNIISSNNNNNNNTNNNNSILHMHKQSIEKEIKNAEKDCAKLDNKRRKAEETVKRADVEYYTLCIRAERARVEWEMSVLRGSSLLQGQENQRLDCLKQSLTTYLKIATDMNPNLNVIIERLTPCITACNVQKDLAVVSNIRRVSEGPSEQLLPDFYCEHTTLAMNRDRRKQVSFLWPNSDVNDNENQGF